MEKKKTKIKKGSLKNFFKLNAKIAKRKKKISPPFPVKGNKFRKQK